MLNPIEEIPEPMYSHLEELHKHDPEVAKELAEVYLAHDYEAQVDIQAFFTPNDKNRTGPEMLDWAKQEVEHGIPSPATLDKWLGELG